MIRMYGAKPIVVTQNDPNNAYFSRNIHDIISVVREESLENLRD